LTGSQNSGPTGGSGIPATFPGDIEAGGNIRAVGYLDATTIKLNGTTVTGIVATGVVPQGIPLTAFKAPAAWKDSLGDTATAAILGLADTPGSVLLASDASNETINQSAVATYVLPHTYIAGSTITVRLRAKQATALSATSSKVDVVAKLVGDTLGTDLCTTNSQQVTTAYSALDFTVTPTGLVAGDILTIEVFCIDIDTTTGGAMSISRVEMRLGTA
jgi:hypothetical protein